MAKDRTTIGQMRELVTVLTVSAESFGEFSIRDLYTFKYSLRARVRDRSGVSARNGIGITDSETTHVIIVRNGSAISIDKTCMIVWRDGIYKVLSVNTKGRTADDPKDRFLQLEVAYDSKATLEVLTDVDDAILTDSADEILFSFIAKLKDEAPE